MDSVGYNLKKKKKRKQSREGVRAWEWIWEGLRVEAEGKNDQNIMNACVKFSINKTLF